MMSAADPVTQDRVYRALKGDYVGGAFAVGARLDIQSLADRYRASKTPVREAVHRLMGEQLIEADQGGGFRIWRPTDATLVQLYAWNAHLAVSLVHQLRAPDLVRSLDRFSDTGSLHGSRQVAARAGAIFLSLAEASRNGEAIAALHRMNERLFYIRISEVTNVQDSIRELRMMTNSAVADVQKTIRRRIDVYHQRRIVQLHGNDVPQTDPDTA